MRNRCGFLGTVALVLGAGLARGAGPVSTQSGDQWAVIIAIREYAEPGYDLRYTLRDAELVKATLVRRGGVPEDHILVMTDTATAALRPNLVNLRREVPAFLARSRPGDRLLVYYSGHGFADAGTTYLAPLDFRRDALATTGLPAAELRASVAACRADVKFLVLDSCHAGGAKGLARRDASSEDLARDVVRQVVPGCVVLASCRGDEESYEWNERRQGAFTYWLCRALEGGGDKDGDGRVTVDEVYEYTQERVSATVAQLLHGVQTPVRLIGGDVAGVPVILTLRPEPPESLCRRLAEHLDLEVRRRHLKKVGVLEFLEPIGRTEGLAAANLPSYCAARVRETLTDLATGAYDVLGADAGKSFRVEDVGDPTAMRRMGKESGGMDAVVLGNLRRRGSRMHVQCDLVATNDGSSLTTPGGLLPLSEDLLADNGVSVNNLHRPPGGPYDALVIEHVLSEAHQGHPLLDKEFPFKVEVWSIGSAPGAPISPTTPRSKKEFINPGLAAGEGEAGNAQRNLLVAARKGEIVEVRVTNTSPNRVALTLLVDGINSLGQKRERLGHAWSWVIEPGATNTIDGWWLPRRAGAVPGLLDDFMVKRFQFTEVAQSVAGRQGFGEAIGLITAAFYAERGRSLAVGEGPEEQRSLRTAGFQPGRLLGAVQIRYVDERDLQDR